MNDIRQSPLSNRHPSTNISSEKEEESAEEEEKQLGLIPLSATPFALKGNCNEFLTPSWH